MRLAYLSLLMLLPICPPAAAQDRPKVMVWGDGVTSCGKFIQAMNENPENEVSFGQWLHGYISGRNEADRLVRDHAAGIDRESLMIWITNYCKSNPLDSFFVAASALISELKAKGRIELR